MNKAVTSLLIWILGFVVMYMVLSDYNDKKVEDVEIKSELVRDSIMNEIAIYQMRIDSLNSAISNINIAIDSLDGLLDSNKVKDKETYEKIMDAKADSSYTIILNYLDSSRSRR